MLPRSCPAPCPAPLPAPALQLMSPVISCLPARPPACLPACPPARLPATMHACRLTWRSVPCPSSVATWVLSWRPGSPAMLIMIRLVGAAMH